MGSGGARRGGAAPRRAATLALLPAGSGLGLGQSPVDPLVQVTVREATMILEAKSLTQVKSELQAPRRSLAGPNLPRPAAVAFHNASTRVPVAEPCNAVFG